MTRSGNEIQLYDDTLRENMSLAVYSAGHQRCHPGHHVLKGSRDFYLVHYVASGKGVFVAGGRTFSLSAGDMFFIFPRSDVYYEADAEDPWDYYWVSFHGTEARRILGYTGFSPENPVMHLRDSDVLREMMINIYRAGGKTPAADTAMTGHLHLFLSELISRTNERSGKDDTQEYLVRAVEYIREEYAAPIRVDDVAFKVGVSRSQLYRAFMREFDVSPNQYIRQYRIQEACALLSSSNLSISAVAAAVGFTDPLYFSRAFHEVKGLSPSQYRQKYAT